MSRDTHRPGPASWPILLLAGTDHSLVVDACIDASTSPLVDRTLWLSIGRDEPDQPDPSAGDTIEVVEHDGTYRDLLAAARWATEQDTDGGAVLLVVDTVSMLRHQLTDEARATASERARAHGWPTTPAGVEVPRELWHDRDQRWHRFINTCRRHPGPVLLTAYLDEVALCTEAGDRTTDTRWEVQAERNLARSVTGVIQWRGAGPVLVEGFTGATYDPAAVSVDFLWRRLGVTDDTTPAARRYTAPVPLTPDAERARVFAQVGAAAHAAGVPREEVAAGWANSHGGQRIDDPAADLDELERTRDALLADAQARQETEA